MRLDHLFSKEHARWVGECSAPMLLTSGIVDDAVSCWMLVSLVLSVSFAFGWGVWVWNVVWVVVGDG